jgi:transcriptional regulator with XRE-family HTH domain
MDNNGLIRELQNKQQEENLTLVELADKLGVSHSTLSRVFAGNRNPGAKLLSGIMTAYPDLASSVALFLSTQVTEVT